MKRQQGIARWMGLAACFLAAALTAGAEDVIVAQEGRTYRGKVKSADAKGVAIEISMGTGLSTITVPRNQIIKATVAPPQSVTQGIEAFEKGNFKEAQTQLVKTLRQYQGLDVDWASKSMICYAKACLAAGNIDQAQQAFVLFAASYPDSSQSQGAKVGLAEIELVQKKYEPALAKFRELAAAFDKELKPAKADLEDAAETYIGIGKCHEGLSNPAEALKAYLRVIALYPAEQYYPEALFRSGMILAGMNRAEQAEIRFDELIRNYPSSEWATRAIDEKKKIAAQPKPAAGAGVPKPASP